MAQRSGRRGIELKRSFLARRLPGDPSRVWVNAEFLTRRYGDGKEQRLPLREIRHLELRRGSVLHLCTAGFEFRLRIGRLLADDHFAHLCRLRQEAGPSDLYSTWDQGQLRHSRSFDWDEALPGAGEPVAELRVVGDLVRCGGLEYELQTTELYEVRPRLSLHEAESGDPVLEVHPEQVRGGQGLVLAAFDNFPGQVEDAEETEVWSRGFRLDLGAAGWVQVHQSSRQVYGDLGAGTLSLEDGALLLRMDRPCHPALLLMILGVQQFLARPGRASALSLHRDSFAAQVQDGRVASAWTYRSGLRLLLMAAVVFNLAFLFVLLAYHRRAGTWGRRGRCFAGSGLDCEAESVHLLDGSLVPCGDEVGPHGAPLMAADLAAVRRTGAGGQLRLGRRRLQANEGLEPDWLEVPCSAAELEAIRRWWRQLLPQGLCAEQVGAGLRPQRVVNFEELLPGQRPLESLSIELSSLGRHVTTRIVCGARSYHVAPRSRLGFDLLCVDPIGSAWVLVVDKQTVFRDQGTPVAGVVARVGMSFCLVLTDGSRIEVDLQRRRIDSQGETQLRAEIHAPGSLPALDFAAPVPELLAVLLLAMIAEREA